MINVQCKKRIIYMQFFRQVLATDTHIQTHTHRNKHLYKLTHTHTCINIFTQTYTHTHTHTHTHTPRARPKATDCAAVASSTTPGGTAAPPHGSLIRHTQPQPHQ